jgi:hypothetical protein
VIRSLLALLALMLVLGATTAFAQPDGDFQRWREEARQHAQEARREAREARDRARRDWDDWRSQDHRDGVHLRILRDYQLDAGATANEPVVVVGGSATINGHVTDDVVVIGGRLKLGPTAVIDGDVFTAGRDADIDPGAQIKGKVDQAVVHMPRIGPIWGPFELPSGIWSFASLGAMSMRLGMVLTISLLLTLIAPGWIRSMASHASSAASSGFKGFLVEVLFVPALLIVSIALIISVIGIPLLAAIPFVMAGGALLWIAGFAGVAVSLGARLRGSSGDQTSVPFLDLLTGFVAITGVTIMAHFAALTPGSFGNFGGVLHTTGLVIEYVAWTIGLGAALSTFFSGRRLAAPPPVPA